MAQQATILKSNKFYRSIQYRSASLNIKPQKICINTDKLPPFQFKKPVTSKSHQRKSKRTLFGSQQNLNHFSKSLSQSLSKINEKKLNSTFESHTNPETHQTHNFGTCSYLQSFEQLMQTEERHTYKRKKMGALSIKLDSLKNTTRIDRIALPNIIEYENSQFTALDPIRLPISGIQEQIQKTRKDMEGCPNQLKSIRFEMKEFHDKTVKKLDEYEMVFKQGAKKLWARLRENSVQHQGFVMRMKREIGELESFLPQFKRQFEASQTHQMQIQKVIFETTPFELKIDQQQNQNLPYQQQLQRSVLNQTYF